MKIGILTQPLHYNYGSILQNYALQKTLKDMGHEVWTIDRNSNSLRYRKYASIIKRLLLKPINRNAPIRVWPTKKEEEIIRQHIKTFIKNNIQTTEKTTSTKQLVRLHQKYAFDAYIVGSDQVWRPRYSPCLTNYFLDFVESERNVKKIAYAASFGVDNWEFTEEQTRECARLAKQFDAISVREDSAVDLCKRYFDVKATHLLDPTMLLNKEIYTSIFAKERISQSPRNLLTYILDKSAEKDRIINNVARKYNLKPFSVMPRRGFSEPGRKDIQDCVLPSVEEWIRGFMDAQFVITDSFHGTVFSILFNKPFISIANKNRGLTRFTSLLKLFQLEDRLIFSSNNFIPDRLKEIDWDKLNAILKVEKDKSIYFLNDYLS